MSRNKIEADNLGTVEKDILTRNGFYPSFFDQESHTPPPDFFLDEMEGESIWLRDDFKYLAYVDGYYYFNGRYYPKLWGVLEQLD